jgi:hypothetical protein
MNTTSELSPPSAADPLDAALAASQLMDALGRGSILRSSTALELYFARASEDSNGAHLAFRRLFRNLLERLLDVDQMVADDALSGDEPRSGEIDPVVTPHEDGWDADKARRLMLRVAAMGAALVEADTDAAAFWKEAIDLSMDRGDHRWSQLFLPAGTTAGHARDRAVVVSVLNWVNANCGEPEEDERAALLARLGPRPGERYEDGASESGGAKVIDLSERRVRYRREMALRSAAADGTEVGWLLTYSDLFAPATLEVSLERDVVTRDMLVLSWRWMGPPVQTPCLARLLLGGEVVAEFDVGTGDGFAHVAARLEDGRPQIGIDGDDSGRDDSDGDA